MHTVTRAKSTCWTGGRAFSQHQSNCAASRFCKQKQLLPQVCSHFLGVQIHQCGMQAALNEYPKDKSHQSITKRSQCDGIFSSFDDIARFNSLEYAAIQDHSHHVDSHDCTAAVGRNAVVKAAGVNFRLAYVFCDMCHRNCPP